MTTWGSGSKARAGVDASVSNTSDTQSSVSFGWYFQTIGTSVDDSNNTVAMSNGYDYSTSGSQSMKVSKNATKTLGTRTTTFTRDHSAHTYTATVSVKGLEYYGTSTTFTASQSYTIPAKTSYTVSYNANGGSGAPSSQTKWYGETLTLSTTRPTRTGYTFLNWGGYAPGGSYTANSSTTLYANWQINTWTVSYNANGGSGAPGSQTKTYGTNLTLSSTQPTRTGYTFKGWATSSSGSVSYNPGGTYSNNSAVTLYAVWQINTWTVAYNANGGSGAPGSQTKTYGQTLTLSTTKPTRTGYTFKGWATSSSGSEVYSPGGSYTSNSGATLYAVWSEITYTYSYNANGGSGAPGNQTKKYTSNLALSTTTPTRTNYNFKGWATTSNATSAQYSSGQSVNINASTTFYAVWELAYLKPTIGNVVIKRCNSDGSLNEVGKYLKIDFNVSVYLIIGENSISKVMFAILDKTGTTTLYSGTVNGLNSDKTPDVSTSTSKTYYGSLITGDNTLDPDNEYIVRLSAYDTQYPSTEIGLDIKVQSAEYIIDFYHDGSGVALGKVAETGKLLDVDYGAKFNGEIISTNSYESFTHKLGKQEISFGIGTDKTNRGIYDRHRNNWMIYRNEADGDGMVINGTLTINSYKDAEGTANNIPPLNIGVTSGYHLELDNNEIMAKANGTTVSELYLNANGGKVYIRGKSLVDAIYPVGAVYISVNATNPGSFLGGAWTQIQNVFLLACGSSYNNGATGGSTTHTHSTGNCTLTTSQIPSHSHTFHGYNQTGSIEFVHGAVNKASGVISASGSYGGTTKQSTTYKDKISFSMTPTGYNNNTGGGGAHNHGNTGSSSNMPPYLAVYMWKRTA